MNSQHCRTSENELRYILLCAVKISHANEKLLGIELVMAVDALATERNDFNFGHYFMCPRA